MITKQQSKPLSPCPPQGSGVHRWLYATACELRRRGEEDTGIEQYLISHATRNNSREIREAVRNSGHSTLQPIHHSQPRWRPRRFIIQKTTLADLVHQSPFDFGRMADPTDVLEILFRPDALLCVGLDRSSYRVGTQSELAGILPRAEFIVPNEARSRSGHTQSGKWSQRCLEMFPKRSYVVIECDPPIPSCEDERRHLLDRQASLLWFLAQKAPLAMVVDSGGKSLHGWFRAHPDEGINQRFIAYASNLGADPASKNSCQLYRMPMGYRATGELHSVLYFNPSVL